MNNKGLTLAEVMVAIAIMGVLALAVPVTTQLLNRLQYQQQMAKVQDDAKILLREMMHEIGNAARVEIFKNQSFSSFPYVTQCLAIKTFDLDAYRETNGTFTNPAMFLEEMGPDEDAYNWKRIYYCVYKEDPGGSINAADYNNDGDLNDTYILKASFNPPSGKVLTPKEQNLVTMLTKLTPNDVKVNMGFYHDVRFSVSFENSIKLNNLDLTFDQLAGTQEIFKINLTVYPSFLAKHNGSKTFNAMAMMRNGNV